MLRTIKTLFGHNINDGTNYRATLLAPNSLAAAQPVFLQQQREDSEDAGTYTVEAASLAVDIVIANYANRISLIAQLQQWLKRGTQGNLVVTYSDDSTDYLKLCRVVSLIQDPDFPQLFHAILVTGWSTWRAVAASTYAWSVTGTGDTYTLALDGDDLTPLSMTFEVTSAPGNGYQYQRYYQLLNAPAPQLPLGYGPWCINLNTAALVTAGKLQADGDDLRVFVDGVEVNRWLSGINTTSTNVWFNITLSQGYSLTLRSALDNSSNYAALLFTATPDTLNRVAAMPNEGILVHGTEWIRYSGKGKYGVFIVERGVLGSTKQAHNVGDAFKLMEHTIMLAYGNTDSVDPSTLDAHYDDTKPLFNLSSSTNASWVYDATTLWSDVLETGRTGGFTPAIPKRLGDVSTYYNIKQNASSGDPALGMLIGSFQGATGWTAELASVIWTFYRSCGVNTTTFTGQKYRSGASWPGSVVGLRMSTDGKIFTSAWAEATPGSAASWTALSAHSGVSMNSSTWLRFAFFGALAAGENAYAAFEILTGTINFVSANLPSGTLLSEAVSGQLDLTLTNAANDNQIEIIRPMLVGLQLVMDAEEKTILYNNVNAHEAVTMDDEGRTDWIVLEPGDNALTIVSVDVGDLDVSLSWYVRRF